MRRIEQPDRAGGYDITIIVPAWGDRPSAPGAVNAYRDACETGNASYEILVLEKPRVWGAAIILGLHYARGAFVLAGGDDVVAQDDEWLPAALDLAKAGDLVGAVILEPQDTGEPEPAPYCPPGVTELPFAITPLALRSTWDELGPLPPTQAYTDVCVAEKAHTLGRRVVVCPQWRAVHLCKSETYSDADADVYEAWREMYLLKREGRPGGVDRP